MTMEDNEMKQDSSEYYTDIASYRKLVKNLIELRRPRSALFWAEKIAVLSNNYPRDVYQLAQCMFMLNEFNRAAHVIKASGLEKSNLLCLTLLVECLFAANDHPEALNLLNSLEIEELNTSLHSKDDTETELMLTNEPNKNVSISLPNVYNLLVINQHVFSFSGHSFLTVFDQGENLRVNG